MNLNNISLWKRFLTNFAKIWKDFAILLSMDTKAWKFQVKVAILWQLSEIGTFLSKVTLSLCLIYFHKQLLDLSKSS